MKIKKGDGYEVKVEVEVKMVVMLVAVVSC